MTEIVHTVIRRGTVESWVERPCLTCGRPTFTPRDRPDALPVGSLETGHPHECAARDDNPEAVTPESAKAFREMLEAVFGKPLHRFSSALEHGLPLAFKDGWKPWLGHVKEFSRSDVKRELDAGAALFALVIPPVRTFAERSGADPKRLRAYLRKDGVWVRHDGEKIRILSWRWPRSLNPKPDPEA